MKPFTIFAILAGICQGGPQAAKTIHHIVFLGARNNKVGLFTANLDGSDVKPVPDLQQKDVDSAGAKLSRDGHVLSYFVGSKAIFAQIY